MSLVTHYFIIVRKGYYGVTMGYTKNDEGYPQEITNVSSLSPTELLQISIQINIFAH
jgi:hypothetical protein